MVEVSDEGLAFLVELPWEYKGSILLLLVDLKDCIVGVPLVILLHLIDSRADHISGLLLIPLFIMEEFLFLEQFVLLFLSFLLFLDSSSHLLL